MSDLCLDEFTSAHCGVPTGACNDATLARYAEMAVVQAAAGDLVGPSGMMDGQVGVVRSALDSAGHSGVGCPHREERAGAFYGPLREAVESTLVGDRRTTSRTRRSRGRARRRGGRRGDGQAGAAVPGRDRGRTVHVDIPVAAYQVSGEYAMVEAAAANGWPGAATR